MKAEQVSKMFPGIIDVLRYHMATGRYSYVDRIAAAMDAKVVEEAVREALRSAVSAVGSASRRVRLRLYEFNKEQKRHVLSNRYVDVQCIESETFDSYDTVPGRVWLHGIVGYDEEEKKVKACYTPPVLPTEDEVAKFIDSIRGNLEVAKMVASLAMTRKRSEEVR